MSNARENVEKLRSIINAKAFGAKGDGVTDDTAALQAAIDFAMYFAVETSVPGTNVNPGAMVLIPTGKYRTTDTLHVGYGVNGFNSVIVTGEARYSNDQSVILTGIIPDFVDRPAINIQGGRNIRIENLAITGRNLAWLDTNYYNITDPSVVANWYGPNISAANNTQFAPYAGITIDAYSRTRPAVSYPDVNYPAFLGTTTQYNKNLSSNCMFENLSVKGFVVGIMQSPYDGASGNGDFTSIIRCDLSFNIVGFAGGNEDARCTNITSTLIHFCHTGIDGRTYGGQSLFPNIGLFCASFDNIYQLMNIETDADQAAQGGQGIQFDNCYSEVMRTFGHVHTKKTSGLVTQAPGVIFNSCKWNFVYGQEYSPAILLDGEDTIVEFNNTMLSGGHKFYNLKCIIAGSGLYMDRGQNSFGTGATQAARVAASYTAGILAQQALNLTVFADAETYYDFGGASFTNKLLDANSFDVEYSTTSYFTQRGLPVPWFIKQLTYGDAGWSVSGLPDLSLNRATYNLTSLVKTTGAAVYKNEYTFTVADTFVANAYGASITKDFAVGSGDIVIDDATGNVFFVAGLTITAGFISFRLRQLTSIRNTGTGASPVWEASGTLSATAGVLRFKNARRFYPAFKRVVATVTAAAATITGAICGSEVTTDADISANTLFLPVSTDDYVISSTKSQTTGDSVFPYGKVTIVDSTTGIITLSQNARRSFYGDIPLFVKGNITGTAP